MRKIILIGLLLLIASPFLLEIYNDLTKITVYLEDGDKIGHLKITPYDTMEIDTGMLKISYAVSNVKFYTNTEDVFNNYELTCDYFSVYDRDEVFLGNIANIKEFRPEAGYVYTWTGVRTDKSIFVNPSYAVLGTVKKREKSTTSESSTSEKITSEQKKSSFVQLFTGG